LIASIFARLQRLHDLTRQILEPRGCYQTLSQKGDKQEQNKYHN
jgi:hypothetical protein